MSTKKFKPNPFLVGALLLLIAVVVYYAFFINVANEGCHCGPIDNDCLYCYVHPFNFGDGIGLLLLFAALYVATGFTKYFPGEKLLPVGSVSGNIIGFMLGVIGVLIIYLT